MRISHGSHDLWAVSIRWEGYILKKVNDPEPKDRLMTRKTVGQNEQEMRDILAEAVEAKQEWALKIARKAGEALEEVNPYGLELPSV